MCSPVKGLAYILNNSYFPGREGKSQHRTGSDVDFKNMKHLFTELGYEIVADKNLKSEVGSDQIILTSFFLKTATLDSFDFRCIMNMRHYCVS